MDLGTTINVIGPVSSAVVAVALTLRSERRARERERAKEKELREQERQQQGEQMRQLLQEMVVEKIETLTGAVNAHEARLSKAERRHARLVGFLEGKGCALPEACSDEKE